jgi:Fur family ferric uptake transcriptional regulator
MQSANQILRNADLKVTLTRIKVVQVLVSSDTKNTRFSAEDIYKLLIKSGDNIGLSTVYRILVQLQAAGLVTRHYFKGGCSLFELIAGDHLDQGL